MTQLFRLFIENFVVVYFDDILIYNQTQEQHMDHLRQVIRTLQAENFYTNPKKCALYRQGYLSWILVSSERVSIDPEKVKTIIEWPQPRTNGEVMNFHGLATFYRRFIRNFNAIVAPITDCLKNEKFQQTVAATKAFKEVI